MKADQAEIGTPNGIGGGLLARNTLLNLVSQLVPGIVALVATPVIIRGLGTEPFGIFSLALVVLGYFSLFDLGLGAATTKFVAEYLGKGDIRRLSGLVWTSLGLQLFLGALGCILLAAAVPLLVGKILNVSPALAGEAKSTFLLLAASLPVVLGTSALRGVLEAGQRFDLVNAVKTPATAATYLIPCIGVFVGLRLPGIVGLLVVARLAAALTYLMLCLRAFPSLRQGPCFQLSQLGPLVAYGSWVTVSNVVGPVFHYLDRVFIAVLLSMTALAYYTGPYQLLGAFWVLPASLVATLFPAFSSLDASGDRLMIQKLYARSLQLLLLTVGPVVLLAIFFARTILRMWLGADFAEQSTLVLQILLFGALINSLALVPYTLLRSLGHPDLTAKFHLLELPVFVGMAWFLVKGLGIQGAALGWTIWVGLNAALLFGACSVLKLVPRRALLQNGLGRSGVVVVAFGIALCMASLIAADGFSHALLAAMLLPVFGLVVWTYGLDSAGQSYLRSGISRLATIRLNSEKRRRRWSESSSPPSAAKENDEVAQTFDLSARN